MNRNVRKKEEVADNLEFVESYVRNQKQQSEVPCVESSGKFCRAGDKKEKKERCQCVSVSKYGTQQI